MIKVNKLSRDELAYVVQQSHSYMEVSKKLGYKNFRANVINKIKQYNLDTSHFKGHGWNRNNFDYSRFSKGHVISSAAALKPLIYKRCHSCQSCGKKTWLGKPIPLEVHHIDGDKLNNCEENLLLLCPNCHAMTDNYRGKGMKTKNSRYISEEDFVEALKKSPNIRQALLTLGLTAKGANYSRARGLSIKYNIRHILEP